jgi:hypothetical protein
MLLTGGRTGSLPADDAYSVGLQGQLLTACPSNESWVANAQGSRELAAERYRLGRTSYPEVIEAQQSALAGERSVAEITGQRWITRVTLIRALGGGWELPGKV